MNVFDIVTIASLALIVVFGLILGLSKGGRFFLTMYGAVSIAAFVAIPTLHIINDQEWFTNVANVFLGYNLLSVVTYFLLLTVFSVVFHFVLHLILKIVGSVTRDEGFASHIGGLMLAILNGALLLMAVLVVFDFLYGKVDTTSIDNVYSSFLYSFLKPVLSLINGNGGN